MSLFIENCVKEILNERDTTFRYIESAQNPADVATRGSSVSEIGQSDLWWHGPTWLKNEDSLWPLWNLPDITPDVLDEINRETRIQHVLETTIVTGETSQQDSLLGIDEKRYSLLRKLLRISVYILRFIKRKIWNKINREKFLKQYKLLRTVLDNVKDSGFISAQEVKLSSLLWTSFIQRRQYGKVFVAIKNKRRHCLVMQLGLNTDEHNVLRCYGRYLHADMTEEAKYPKLLPHREHFTHLVIQEVHNRLVHSDTSHILSQIRQEFWIPQGRAEVRFVLSRCVICKRNNGAPFALPRMPPWPKERVSKSVPFQYVGLDYLGPIRVKENGEVQKMWICLFTCLAVRAIHLELVKGLSAEQFLDCLRRYIARRGKPEVIISDNAPQFKLVKTVLDQQWCNLIKSDDVMNFFSSTGIVWRFTTAMAPLQGGFYERLVGLVKQSLRKGIGRKLLYWDKLLTMLVEVEAIINTRPLTYVCSEFSSGFTLTPAHFLSGNLDTVFQFSSDDYEETEYKPKKDSAQELIDRWKKGQEQLNRFWEIWRRDYLLSLRTTLPLHHKGSHLEISRQPKVGEIVILQDENMPRRTWKLALIKEFIHSKDGQIRSVKIELPNKLVLSRAINHLYPLEIQAASDLTQANSLTNKIEKDLKLSKPPLRAASIEAHKRIALQMDNQPVMMAFSYPGECRGHDDVN